VRCEIVTSIPQSLEPKAEEITASVASLRLDAILCRVLNLPRDGGAQLIRDGYVFVSGRQEESASYVPKENEIITVRGYGKLCFCGIKGTSAKGRLQITVKKYK
jgi:RNA-binding protein YlmH